jgi:hypothetical protein
MRKVFLGLCSLAILASCKNSNNKAEETLVKSATAEQKTPPPAEFADTKYVDWGKMRMAQFEKGNIDEWSNQFADNAVYSWNSGDSLAGKKAIIDYWKNRYATVLESLKFDQDIWLAVKVNQPQKGPDMPGVWLMEWMTVEAKYKNGKTMKQWMHMDTHYNDQNQVDRVVQYIDRAAINAALGMK